MTETPPPPLRGTAPLPHFVVVEKLPQLFHAYPELGGWTVWDSHGRLRDLYNDHDFRAIFQLANGEPIP